jgi:hypothetical protein
MGGLNRMPFIFPDLISHEEMKKKLNYPAIASAGFVTLDIVNNEPIAKCYGKSLTLNIASNETDGDRITMFLRGY